MPRERYIVEIDRPREMSVAEMREYIGTAVNVMAGSYTPDHPMFDNDSGVKVKRLTPPMIRRMWQDTQ